MIGLVRMGHVSKKEKDKVVLFVCFLPKIILNNSMPQKASQLRKERHFRKRLLSYYHTP